jgi:hypothetical protein
MSESEGTIITLQYSKIKSFFLQTKYLSLINSLFYVFEYVE